MRGCQQRKSGDNPFEGIIGGASLKHVFPMDRVANNKEKGKNKEHGGAEK